MFFLKRETDRQRERERERERERIEEQRKERERKKEKENNVIKIRTDRKLIKFTNLWSLTQSLYHLSLCNSTVGDNAIKDERVHSLSRQFVRWAAGYER